MRHPPAQKAPDTFQRRTPLLCLFFRVLRIQHGFFERHALIPTLIHDVVRRNLVDLVQQLLLHRLELQRIDFRQVFRREVAFDGVELHNMLLEVAHVVLRRVDLDDFLVQPGQLIDSFQRCADGRFHREHHVARHFDKLPDEAEIRAAVRHDLRAVGAGARHELAGDVGHHAGGDVRVRQHLVVHVHEVEVVENFGQDFLARAFRHRLLEVVADALAEQPVAPEAFLVVRPLIREVIAVVEHQAHFPAGILHRNAAARSRLAARQLFEALEKFGIVLDGHEVAHPLRLVNRADELFGMTELLMLLREILPDGEQTQIVRIAVGRRDVRVVAESAVRHQRAVRHEDIILRAHVHADFFAIDAHPNALRRIAFRIHIHVVHRAAGLDGYALFFQLQSQRLDDGVILVALGVQDAFRIVNASPARSGTDSAWLSARCDRA